MKKVIGFLLLMLSSVAYPQASPGQVWSCNPTDPNGTNPAPCNLAGNTYNDGQFRPSSPSPVYVGTTNGTRTNCSTNWWNTPGAVAWRRPSDLNKDWCVARKINGIESFGKASEFGWGVVTIPPPPPASPTVIASVSKSPALTYEVVRVTWSSTNAVTCRGTWQALNAPNLTTSGSADIGPFLFPQIVELSVRCLNSVGVDAQGGAALQIVGVAPLCYFKNEEEFYHHVKLGILPLSVWSSGYQGIATWYCQTPAGIKQETWVYGTTTVTDKIQRFREGLITLEQIRNDCNRDCRIIPAGPLDDARRAFAARWTVEDLGVIE